VVMPTALVIMPTTPEGIGEQIGMAYAALSDIGLTSEENPRKKIKTETFLVKWCIFEHEDNIHVGRCVFRRSRWHLDNFRHTKRYTLR
jgi:hypothetical protein